MNKRDAYKLGLESGEETAIYGDFTPEELADEEKFMSVCYDIFENKRQYTGSPTYDMAGLPNSEGLFDEFDRGETNGAIRYYRKHHKNARKEEETVTTV